MRRTGEKAAQPRCRTVGRIRGTRNSVTMISITCGSSARGQARSRRMQYDHKCGAGEAARARFPDRIEPGALEPISIRSVWSPLGSLDRCLPGPSASPARLEKLTLAGNLITDSGLSQIATITNLKTLDLEATEVSDAGLIHLEGMKNLKVVNLGATHVTKEGLAKLQMARPDLTIELDVEPAVEEGVKMRRGIAP